MSIEYYRGLLRQRTRIDAFRRGIRDTVRSGDVVLEIGAGLGTFSFFAAEAGARKVWAIEGNAIVNVAKAIARVNGFADRVEFLRGWYPDVAPGEPADVLIFEDYPTRLLDEATHDVLTHLHRAHLRAGGRCVPSAARVCLAPAYSKRGCAVPLGTGVDTAYDIDWSPSRDYAAHRPAKLALSPDELRGDPVVVAEPRLDRPPHAGWVSGEARWSFDQPTTVNGIAFWFELGVADVWLSNAPGGDPGAWGTIFLPLADSHEVPAGEPLTVSVKPTRTPAGGPGWMRWTVRCGAWEYTGHEFKSIPASLSDVVPADGDWVPQLTEQARMESYILEIADGTRSLDAIARSVAARWEHWGPDRARSLVSTVLTGRVEPVLDSGPDPAAHRVRPRLTSELQQ